MPFDIHAVVLYYNKDLLAGTPYLDADGKLTGIDEPRGLRAPRCRR